MGGKEKYDEKLLLIMGRACGIFADKEMRVLAHEWKALSDPFSREIRKLMREYARVVSGAFRELAPERTEEEVRAATFGLFGMLTWVDQWHRPERDLPLDRLADQFTAIILGGFLPNTPLDPYAEDSGSEESISAWDQTNSTASIFSGPGF